MVPKPGLSARLFKAGFDSLGSRYAPVAIIAVALLLCASSLGGDRTLDDWVLAVVTRGEGAALGLSSKRWDCFTFTTGDPLQNAALMSRGVLLPWWTDPELKLAFFRPLSAVTHLLDELLWRARPTHLHAHSLFWFSSLLVAVGALYRQFSADSRLANLAFALYAWDDAHGATLSWLANRNALISGVFGCACIAAHDLWRRGRGRQYGLLALGCFALSCLASELAVGALAYLVAYAAFIDRSPLRQRFLSLLGYGLAVLSWRTAWSVAGYGARGSASYVDPLFDPLGFLAAAPHKWLCLLQGQLGIIPADFGFLGSASQQGLWILTALFTLAGAAVLLRPCLAERRERFWLAGALLSLVPMAASFPSDRLLVFVGLGFMPLFARAFQLRLGEPIEAPQLRKGLLLPCGLALSFFAVHGIFAPLLLPLRAAQMGRMARAESDALRDLRALAGTTNKALIILNAPSVVLASYAQLRLRAQGQPPFARLYVLSAADSPVVVSRSGTSELTLQAEQGFLRSPLERHYRAQPSSLAAQGRVELPGLTAEVAASLADGRPQALRFAFTAELSEYVFVCWSEGHFRRCQLPEPGQALRLPADDLGRILFGKGSGSSS
jgi:hypothetical protein